MEAFRILLTRPLPREWTEKCFVAFLLLLGRSEYSDSKRIRTLRGVIDALEKRGYPSISAKAAHATVIVRQTPMIIKEKSWLIAYSASGKWLAKPFSRRTTGLHSYGFRCALIRRSFNTAPWKSRLRYKSQRNKPVVLLALEANIYSGSWWHVTYRLGIPPLLVC